MLGDEDGHCEAEDLEGEVGSGRFVAGGSVSLSSEVAGALPGLSSRVFVMTSRYEDKRSGARVLSVQRCACSPLMIAVALRKGHVVETLIRDSHAFAVCEIAADDRLGLRKFPDRADEADGVVTDDENSGDREDSGLADPFDALATKTLKTGAPVLARSPLVLDCEVMRHFDLEADHELYVGLVVDGRVRTPAAPTGGEPAGTG